MASLNTLRTRGALFLSIIIGIALIAFLLGDLTSASSIFQSRRNRVGSVDGNNIDYMEFAAKADNMNRVIQALYGGNALTPEQTDQVREMVWESYIRQYSYDPGFRKLGIAVGESEQIDMVRGAYPSPVISAMFSGGTGMYDPAALEEFILRKEQDTSGQMEAVWQYIKTEMADERAFSKFTALVGGGAFVNDLEVGRGLEIANTLYDGRFATVPFSSIADSTVMVSTSEAKKYYNDHKNNFKQTASRDVEYVAFRLAPSEEDKAAAEAQVKELAEQFAVAGDAMQFASLNSQERVDQTYHSASQLSPELAAIAFGRDRGGMVGPTLEGNVWTISRAGAEKMAPDSVGARHILLDFGRLGAADSLVKAIKGGASIFDLAPLYSIDPTVDLGHFAPDMMVAPFADAVVAARVGDVFRVETQFGTHVVQVTYKAPAVRKVQIATITYNAEPSAATEQAAYNSARDFLALAAGSAEKFDSAVVSTGAASRVATIGAADREVRGLADSREMVRWSFNSKPGTVSTIFEIDDNYVVAVVKGAKEAGFSKFEDVSAGIGSRLREDKKVEMLAEQFAGKSIDEIAAMTDATRGDFAGLRPSLSYEANMGYEPGVIGALTAISADVVSGPIRGLTGMYVLEITAATPIDEIDEVGERVRLETAIRNTLPGSIMQALRDGSDIVDNRAKFF